MRNVKKNKSNNSCNREKWNHTKINQKILNSVFGKHDIKHLQKTAIFETAHILREVLMKMYETFIMENEITCAKYCNYRISVILYTLET
jgi:hypothetical protein